MEEEFLDEIKKDGKAIVNKVEKYVTLHWNSNRPRNRGAEYIVIKYLFIRTIIPRLWRRLGFTKEY